MTGTRVWCHSHHAYEEPSASGVHRILTPEMQGREDAAERRDLPPEGYGVDEITKWREGRALEMRRLAREERRTSHHR